VGKHTFKGSIEVIVEHNVSDQDSKDDLSVSADEIGLSTRDWQDSVQLEDFLSYPFDIKNTIEHKKNSTGTQNLMFLYDLKENYCHMDTRLEVKHLPESLKFKDWKRSVEEMEAESSMLSVSEVWKNKLYSSFI
jgi:hypothetical protein